MQKMCKACRGSGKVLGGGFVQVICEVCNGTAKICNSVAKDKNKDSNYDARNGNKNLANFNSNSKIDRRSKEYREAIKELTSQGLTEKEAKKIFDEELEKIDGEG